MWLILAYGPAVSSIRLPSRPAYSGQHPLPGHPVERIGVNHAFEAAEHVERGTASVEPHAALDPASPLLAAPGTLLVDAVLLDEIEVAGPPAVVNGNGSSGDETGRHR
jgi:hypothetical protein